VLLFTTQPLGGGGKKIDGVHFYNSEEHEVFQNSSFAIFRHIWIASYSEQCGFFLQSIE
jgi:hypothetical protein